jgi:hypothetical protein
MNTLRRLLSLPCRARFGKAETARKAWSMLHETPCSPPVAPLMELLAIPLSRQRTAAKRLVIPKGEGYGRSLRGYNFLEGHK